MSQLVLLVGPPGSGKSTLARKYEEAGYIRVSQDDHGKEGHKEKFTAALFSGSNIVVDRMNFDRKQRARYIDPARKLGYEIEIRILQVPHDVCLERMRPRFGLTNFTHPTISSEEGARSALHTFFTKYERPTGDEADVVHFLGHEDPRNERPECIIVDLDGTLCNIEHRVHHVRDGNRRWREFYAGVSGDEVNDWCYDLVKQMARRYSIVFCSGRPSDECGAATISWLNDVINIKGTKLVMRYPKDYRKDWIIKEILLDFEILPRYRVLFAVDDRQQVVDMWRRRGITCLQCAEGNF